jgi:hypothetical protein
MESYCCMVGELDKIEKKSEQIISLQADIEML